MNEPPGARARVGLTGLTVAEYFRDEEGKDVLLFIDNIFLCGKKSYFGYFSLNLDDVCVDIEFITGNVSASLSGKEQILDFF